MIHWFQHRRHRKRMEQLLREAAHIRHMREDIARPDDLQRLDDAVRGARQALGAQNWDALPACSEAVQAAAGRLWMERPNSAWRENVEILAVAIAVAMAFRAYFVQPFKIPTGSMSPTLYGIHYEPCEQPGLLDHVPLKWAKWLVTGRWYVEIHATTSGTAQWASRGGDSWGVWVDNQYHPVYDSARPYYDSSRYDRPLAHYVTNGESVIAGQRLASGYRVAGDHIFVNKIVWNYRAPRRGEIMVFRTDGLPMINKREFYVKRMVGLPNETLEFHPPMLHVDGQPLAAPASIARVEQATNGYAGYRLEGNYVGATGNHIRLDGDQFFACGDNQPSSLDSRYWGPVPRQNLVGPAVVVYWPIGRHWGLAR